MSQGAQVDVLWAGLTDNSGNPLGAGKVYTYIVGTTTDKDMYTDLALTSAETNPIILDAYGRAQVYAEGSYKLVVKDSDDSTLYTLDNLEFGGDSVDAIDDWTPTLNANSGTYTSTTVNEAKYAQISDELVWASLYVTGTTGSAPAYLRATIPVSSGALTVAQSWGCVVDDPGTAGVVAGYAILDTSASEFRIYRYDSASFGNAASTTFRLTCVYRI